MLFLLCLILVSSHASSGGGNGGRGVVCRNYQTGEIEKAIFRDFVDSKNSSLKITEHHFNLNEILTLIEKRLESFSKLTATAFKAELDLIRSDELQDINHWKLDIVHDFKSAGFKIECNGIVSDEQVANYQDEEKKLLIVKNIFEHFSDFHKAGLYTHEALYAFYRSTLKRFNPQAYMTQEYSADQIQRLTALLFSKENEKNNSEISKIITELNTPYINHYVNLIKEQKNKDLKNYYGQNSYKDSRTFIENSPTQYQQILTYKRLIDSKEYQVEGELTILNNVDEWYPYCHQKIETNNKKAFSYKMTHNDFLRNGGGMVGISIFSPIVTGGLHALLNGSFNAASVTIGTSSFFAWIAGVTIIVTRSNRLSRALSLLNQSYTCATTSRNCDSILLVKMTKKVSKKFHLNLTTKGLAKDILRASRDGQLCPKNKRSTGLGQLKSMIFDIYRI